jgi:uncharacterized membrane protein YczE
MPAQRKGSLRIWTFAYAILWGGWTIFVALGAPDAYPSKAIAITTAAIGVVVIAAGFAVYRGSRLGAAILVGIACLDILARVRYHRSGIGMPIIMFALALPGVLPPKGVADTP